MLAASMPTITNLICLGAIPIRLFVETPLTDFEPIHTAVRKRYVARSSRRHAHWFFFASGWSLALGTIRNLKLNSTAPAACSYTESTLRPVDEHLLEGYAWSRTGRCNQISRMRHEDMWIVTAQGAGPRLRRCVVLFLPL